MGVSAKYTLKLKRKSSLKNSYISLHSQAFNKEILQIMVVSMPTTYRGNMSKKSHQQGYRSVQTL